MARDGARGARGRSPVAHMGRHHSSGFVRKGVHRDRSRTPRGGKCTAKKDPRHTITIRDCDTNGAAADVARARFCLELLWLVAMFALDHVGLLSVPLLAARPSMSHLPLQLQAAVPVLEELVPVAKTDANIIVEEIVEEDAESSSESHEGIVHEQYEQFIRGTARSLPALAVATPAPRGKNGGGLRQSLLKRGLARGVILHGMAALHAEVANDAAQDSRASLALADFHKVEEGFQHGEAVAPGTPKWKRLCRVVSFLKRNADAAVA